MWLYGSDFNSLEKCEGQGAIYSSIFSKLLFIFGIFICGRKKKELQVNKLLNTWELDLRLPKRNCKFNTVYNSLVTRTFIATSGKMCSFRNVNRKHFREHFLHFSFIYYIISFTTPKIANIIFIRYRLRM